MSRKARGADTRTIGLPQISESLQTSDLCSLSDGHRRVKPVSRDRRTPANARARGSSLARPELQPRLHATCPRPADGHHRPRSGLRCRRCPLRFDWSDHRTTRVQFDGYPAPRRLLLPSAGTARARARRAALRPPPGSGSSTDEHSSGLPPRSFRVAPSRCGAATRISSRLAVMPPEPTDSRSLRVRNAKPGTDWLLTRQRSAAKRPTPT